MVLVDRVSATQLVLEEQVGLLKLLPLVTDVLVIVAVAREMQDEGLAPQKLNEVDFCCHGPLVDDFLATAPDGVLDGVLLQVKVERWDLLDLRLGLVRYGGGVQEADVQP